MLYLLVMVTVHHSLGIFIVPGKESADFDKSSGPPNRTGSWIKGLSCEGYLPSITVSEGENGHGVHLAAGAFFLACLLARVKFTWGSFASVCLLSHGTFTCNGKHRPYWRQSESLHGRWTALNRCIIEYAATLPNVFRLMVYRQTDRQTFTYLKATEDKSV